MPEPAAALAWLAAVKAPALIVAGAGALVIADFDYFGTSRGIGYLGVGLGLLIYACMEAYARGKRKIREAEAGDALARIESLERSRAESEGRVLRVSAEFQAFKEEAEAKHERLERVAAEDRERFVRLTETRLAEQGLIRPAPLTHNEEPTP